MKKFIMLALTLTLASPTASVALADPCYGCRTVTPTPTATPTTTAAPAPTTTETTTATP